MARVRHKHKDLDAVLANTIAFLFTLVKRNRDRGQRFNWDVDRLEWLVANNMVERFLLDKSL